MPGTKSALRTYAGPTQKPTLNSTLKMRTTHSQRTPSQLAPYDSASHPGSTMVDISGPTSPHVRCPNTDAICPLYEGNLPWSP